jgi:two-component system, OmpR family, response regulator
LGSATPLRPGPGTGSLSVMRLLVVEDFPVLREALVRGLRDCGYAVDASGDGEEGLWYATSNDYDAILLDIMLPGIDGIELLRRLRAKGSTVPVLLLTARDSVDDRVQGLDSGADDYLIKPFAVPELLARVGDLRVDTAARRAWRGTAELDLAPREWALLHLLAANAGRVVTRQEIGEHLYDFERDITPNAVEAAVARLRRKLGSDGEPVLLHTRRGIGYVLAVGAEVDNAE